jgi:hypothetical protein
MAMRFLFALLCAAALVEALGVWCVFQKKSTIPLFFAYTLAEGFFLLPLYYFKAENKAFKFSVSFGFACFVTVTVFKLLLNWSNEILNTVIALQVLCFSAVVLYRMQRSPDKKNQLRSSFFWINLGFFVYYGGSLFFLMFENSVRYAPDFLRNSITALHMIINISYNVLLSIGLCKISRR